MTCSDYVSSFTDYLDGSVPEDALRDFEAHVESCEACGRYRVVVEKGGELLRSLPEPELTEDFGPRLQHRLYHVDEGQGFEGTASATPAMTVVGMALLLTAIAWAPALWQRVPEIALEPIVVDQPPMARPMRPVSALPRDVPRGPVSDFERGLWDNAHALLYEYSPLSQRYRQRAGASRTGIDQDR